MITGDTTITISLAKLGRNMDAVCRMAGENVAVMAVIKANGYGHGAVLLPIVMKRRVSRLSI